MSQQWDDPKSPDTQNPNPGGLNLDGTPMPYSGMQYNNMGLLTVGERRDPIMVVVLGLITCGFYSIYWLITYSTEVKNALGRDDLNPVVDLLIGIITCGIYSTYCFGYKYPKLLVDMQQRVGLPANDISTTTLILFFIFAPISIYMIQNELNKIWAAASQGG